MFDLYAAFDSQPIIALVTADQAQDSRQDGLIIALYSNSVSCVRASQSQSAWLTTVSGVHQRCYRLQVWTGWCKNCWHRYEWSVIFRFKASGVICITMITNFTEGYKNGFFEKTHKPKDKTLSILSNLKILWFERQKITTSMKWTLRIESSLMQLWMKGTERWQISAGRCNCSRIWHWRANK